MTRQLHWQTNGAREPRLGRMLAMSSAPSLGPRPRGDERSPGFWSLRAASGPGTWRLNAGVALLVLGLLGQAAAVPETAGPGPGGGPSSYAMACSACHGPAGRYDPTQPGVKALDPKPADFTDPLFNSREPAADWFMVTKHGGSPMGFSASMPAFRDAYSDAEIEEMIAYLKTLAGPHNYPPGDLNYLRAFRTKKAWLEDEVVFPTRYSSYDGGHDVLSAAIEFEKRWFARWQTELKLAYEVEGGDGDWDEVEAGLKYALYDNVQHTFLLSAGADFAVSLQGSGEAEAIPYLAGGKGLGEFLTLQASVRSHLPFPDAAEGDVEVATALHWLPTPWPRGVFPGIELTARAPFDSGDRDLLEWTVLPQLNFGLSRRGHVRAAVGVELPLNERTYDYRVHFYLLWDFADGMFWEGWRKGRARGVSEYE